MEELLQLLGGYHTMSAELQVSLFSMLQKEHHRSNKFLLEEGQVCDWIDFIEKGMVKVYVEQETGEETIVWLYKEGDVISAVQSYYHNAPSLLNIRTLEETTIRRIRKPAIERL
jgi:CRP-like cAMP-binding protein